jgi:hypothetical protein
VRIDWYAVPDRVAAAGGILLLAPLGMAWPAVLLYKIVSWLRTAAWPKLPAIYVADVICEWFSPGTFSKLPPWVIFENLEWKGVKAIIWWFLTVEVSWYAALVSILAWLFIGVCWMVWDENPWREP